MRCLRKSIVAAVLSAVLSSSVPASERGSLSGFRTFLFGMTEDEIRRIVSVEESGDRKFLGRLTATHPIEIDGMPFRLSFRFNLAGLSEIELQNRMELASDACRERFDHALDLVRAWYGEPDAPPAREVFSGMAAALNRASTLQSAYFAFRDGARIRVFATYFERMCERSISFAGRTYVGDLIVRVKPK
jgi:hypothetical protein